MAKKTNSEKMLEQQRELNKISAEQLRILQEQNKALEQQVKQAEDRAKVEGEVLGLTDNAIQLSKQLGKFSREDLSSKAKRNKLENLHEKVLAEKGELLKQADKYNNKNDKTSKAIARTIKAQADSIDESVKGSKLLLREYNRFDKATKGFNTISNLVKDIPVLRQAFKGFANMSNKASEAFKKTGSVTQARFAGLKSAAGGLATVLISALIGGIVKGLTGIDNSITSLQHNLQLTADVAGKVSRRLSSVASVKITFDQLTEATIELSSNLQTASVGAVDTVKTMFTLTKRLGMSSSAAANLYKFSALVGKSFQDATADVIGITSALNDSNNSNLRYKDILSDIASVSSATLLTTQKFPGGIARAAFQARKLGLSFQSLESASSGLLNFESSISSELESELLTGKQLNLQKAREAALMGDQATLAAEISKNVGSAAEFGKMNVLQQEAVAKAVGLSREELSKSLIQREALLELEKETKIEGLSRLSTEKQIQQLTEKYKKDGLSAAEARNKALRDVGQNELANMERTQTAQDDLKNALALVGTKLGILIQEITGLSNPLRSLSDNILKLVDVFSEWFMDGLNEDERNERDKLIAQAENKGKELSKEEASNIIKGLRGNSFMDYASLLTNPGVGVNRLLVNNAIKESAQQRKQAITVDDFTIATNPKDSLVMAGGTKFGDETNTLLRELITAVKQGGNVTLDGRKVGETLALSYNKL